LFLVQTKVACISFCEESTNDPKLDDEQTKTQEL